MRRGRKKRECTRHISCDTHTYQIADSFRLSNLSPFRALSVSRGAHFLGGRARDRPGWHACPNLVSYRLLLSAEEHMVGRRGQRRWTCHVHAYTHTCTHIHMYLYTNPMSSPTASHFSNVKLPPSYLPFPIEATAHVQKAQYGGVLRRGGMRSNETHHVETALPHDARKGEKKVGKGQPYSKYIYTHDAHLLSTSPVQQGVKKRRTFPLYSRQDARQN